MACNNLIHTISFSNNTPVIGESVTCTATVTNNGSTTEQFHVVFAQSGLQPFSTSTVRTIDPGDTVLVTGTFQGTIATTVNICADLICDTPVSTLAANFSGTPTSGYTPLTVTYTNLTTGGTPPYVCDWYWWNDVDVDRTELNPVKTYTATGIHTTKLVVTDSLGAKSTMRKASYITVSPVASQLVADFFASPGSGSPPLTVQFTDTSTGSPTSWSWAFGDGSTSTTRSPSHIYSSVGTYTVTLTVSNTNGSDSASTTISVSDVPSNTYVLADHGILANGSNETSKLQSALNAASSGGYDAISFPSGKTIGINNPIYFPGSMEYIGNGCTIKTLPDSDIGHWVWTIDTGTNCHIHHLILDGDMDNQHIPTPDPSYYFPWMPNDGIMLRQGAVFENNEVKRYGGYMVETLSTNGVIIRNNYLHHGWQYAICTAGSSSRCTNALIEGNTIYWMGQVGVKVTDSSYCTIRNNTITMPARYDLFSDPSDGSLAPTGVRLYSADGSSDHITITGNTITGTGGNYEVAIESDDVGTNSYITVTNNIINNARLAIYVNYSGGTVTGNAMTGCGTCISGSGSGVTISNNTCV